MRPHFLILSLLAALLPLSRLAAQPGLAGSPATTLWFAQPAVKWTEALPVGNGRLGAMVFGGIADERIQFNEDTLWTGHPRDYANTNALAHLPEIRQLLASGQNKLAGLVAKTNFLGTPSRQKAYQPFGDLHLHFIGTDNATNYHRELDLATGIARTRFRAGDTLFQRDVFASQPGQAIVLHLTADKAAQISFTLQLTSPHTNAATKALAADTLALTGQVETDGLRFESRVRVVVTGGSLSQVGNALTVSNADAVSL